MTEVERAEAAEAEVARLREELDAVDRRALMAEDGYAEAVKLLRELTCGSFGSEVADAAFEARAFLARSEVERER